jgi:TonB family protein
MSHRWLISVSVGAHLAVGVGLFVSGVWRLERMHPGREVVTVTLPTPIPAPSGGPVAAEAPKITPKVPKPKVPPVPVQPTTVTPRVTPEAGGGSGETTGSGGGPGDENATGTCTENCGEAVAAPPVCGDRSLDAGEQCDDGNALDGDGCSFACRTEPPPRQRDVTPVVLQGLRISGETQIRPSALTQQQMMRDDARQARGVVRVCVASDGGVTSAALLSSTGYTAYDELLLSAVHRWRYRPYLVNGTPVAVCGTVTFLYSVK